MKEKKKNENTMIFFHTWDNNFKDNFKFGESKVKRDRKNERDREEYMKVLSMKGKFYFQYLFYDTRCIDIYGLMYRYIFEICSRQN